MTHDMKQALEQALVREGEAVARAEEKITVCVEALAEGLVDHALAITRRASQSQPEVSTALGRAGIAALRTDVTEVAEQLATDIVADPTSIEWPLPQGEYDTVKPRTVQTAIFTAWYRGRADAIAKVIERHGFEVQRNARDGGQSLVLPQFLYAEPTMTPHFQSVADAQNSVGAARRAVEKATAALKREAVDSLWD